MSIRQIPCWSKKLRTQALQLFIVENKNYAEIAKEMGCTAHAINALFERMYKCFYLIPACLSGRNGLRFNKNEKKFIKLSQQATPRAPAAPLADIAKMLGRSLDEVRAYHKLISGDDYHRSKVHELGKSPRKRPEKKKSNLEAVAVTGTGKNSRKAQKTVKQYLRGRNVTSFYVPADLKIVNELQSVAILVEHDEPQIATRMIHKLVKKIKDACIYLND